MKLATVTCRFCGATRDVPAWVASRYSTCGADTCIAARRAEGGRKNAGKTHSDEARARISEAARGRQQSAEHVAARVAARRANGAWFSDPAIGEKISEGKAAGKQPDVKGPKNGMWRGGLSKLPQGRRGGIEYNAWRDAVLSRANYRCEECGTDKFVIAHHLASWHTHPHLRTDPDNGRALCRRCHIHAHEMLAPEPGQWPLRPSISTILCRYCGGPRAVRTCQVASYVTCGRSECVALRVRDAVARMHAAPRPDTHGEKNPKFRTGQWTASEKTCTVCGTTFVGPARRKFCSPACSAVHKSATQMGQSLSEERRERMRGAKRVKKTEKTCPKCGASFLGFHQRKYCDHCR